MKPTEIARYLLLIMDGEYLSLNIYFDVDIRVQELLQNFRVRFSTAIEADLVMEGVADQMVYQLLDLVKMQDR